MKSTNHIFKSKVTLQLRAADTGRVIEERVGSNFTANQAIRYAKWLQRQQYKTGLSSIATTDTDYQQHPATDALVLTDSTLNPDPTNEWTMPGKLVGYATKATYAGSDIFRGTPNTAQLDAQTTYTKWVFDWPTNAGNGTINSVGWVSNFFSSSATDGSGPCFFSGSTIEQTWTTPQIWRYLARANANLSFGNLGNTVIYVLNSTYQQNTTFNVSGQFTAVRGIAWDSGNSFLWVIGDNGAARRIAAYNSAGVLQTGPYTLTTRSYVALAHDGTKLWTTSQISNENFTMWSLSTSDGSDVSNFNFSTYNNTAPGNNFGYNNVAGLCWDSASQRLWVKTTYTNTGYWGQAGIAPGRAGAMYAFDTSGNKVMLDVSLAAWNPSTVAQILLWGSNEYTDIDIIDSSQFVTGRGTTMYRFRLDGMGTRYKLDSPVVKSNAQTLKVIYQINYI